MTMAAPCSNADQFELRPNPKETAMASIIPFLRNDGFDPDAVRAMSTALEEVCRMFKVGHDQRAREVMAARIIELAQRGERDPERLRDRVLREAGATAWVVHAGATGFSRGPDTRES